MSTLYLHKLKLILAPSQPTNVKAGQSGPTTIHVSWNPPKDRNGQLKNYIVKCCPVDICGTPYTAESASPETNSADVGGVTAISKPLQCWVIASVEKVSEMPQYGGPILSTESEKSPPFTMTSAPGKSVVRCPSFCVNYIS